MDHRVKMQNYKNNLRKKKHRIKSLGSWAKQRVLKLYIKNTMNTGNIDKLDFTKLKTFVLWETLLRGWKDKLQIGKKYLQTTYLTKDLYLDCIKNSQNTTSKDTGKLNHSYNADGKAK